MCKQISLHKLACRPNITAQYVIKLALLNHQSPIISPHVVPSVSTTVFMQKIIAPFHVYQSKEKSQNSS
jgi:hypothetical protein